MWETDVYIEHYKLYFNGRIQQYLGFNNGGVARKTYELTKDFYSPLKILFRNFPKKISIYDLGGGGGDNYAKVKIQFPELAIDYVVDDSVKIWRATAHLRSQIRGRTDKLQHISELINKPKADVAFVIGTSSFIENFNLQYLLDKLENAPHYIYFDRTFFTLRDKSFDQQVKLKDSDAQSYRSEQIKHHSITKKSLKNQCDSLGYSIIKQGIMTPWILNSTTGKKFGFYQELVFEKQ